MSAYEIFAAAGLVSVVIALGYILAGSPKIGSATLAAGLAAGFGAFTAVTIAREGVLLVWTNHTENLWGVQVWWDLLFAVGIAVFLIAPRARAAGMNLWPWLVFVAATASIGLLAMVARLFWLEARTEA
ncbi:hypothetical protein LCL94_11215 [Qipengyuania gaetbuli]|nr:hypothetical protein [Qipengyuania gaetbuli]MCA0910979.1 hypothetical protein [Qipengyuania gaetbuli]